MFLHLKSLKQKKMLNRLQKKGFKLLHPLRQMHAHCRQTACPVQFRQTGQTVHRRQGQYLQGHRQQGLLKGQRQMPHHPKGQFRQGRKLQCQTVQNLLQGRKRNRKQAHKIKTLIIQTLRNNKE